MLTIEDIEAANAREERQLRFIVGRLLEQHGEFYSTQLVDAWLLDSRPDVDRRTAFNTVQRLLRGMEAEGELAGRFEQKQGKGSGIGRKYYRRGGGNGAVDS